eukprot:1159381-Pelagomonas_calceolata.AAC.19
MALRLPFRTLLVAHRFCQTQASSKPQDMISPCMPPVLTSQVIFEEWLEACIVSCCKQLHSYSCCEWKMQEAGCWRHQTSKTVARQARQLLPWASENEVSMLIKHFFEGLLHGSPRPWPCHHALLHCTAPG